MEGYVSLGTIVLRVVLTLHLVHPEHTHQKLAISIAMNVEHVTQGHIVVHTHLINLKETVLKVIIVLVARLKKVHRIKNASQDIIVLRGLVFINLVHLAHINHTEEWDFAMFVLKVPFVTLLRRGGIYQVVLTVQLTELSCRLIVPLGIIVRTALKPDGNTRVRWEHLEIRANFQVFSNAFLAQRDIIVRKLV